MPKKFDQDAKDHVARLVEDRILAESISTQTARRYERASERLPKDLADENARLRRENQKLRDTNEFAQDVTHPST